MIIIEGYRKSGKTFISKILSKLTGKKYLKVPVELNYCGQKLAPSDISLFLYGKGRDDVIKEVLFGKRNIILDRGFISNGIYSYLFGRISKECMYDYIDDYITQFITKRNNKIIFVKTIKLLPNIDLETLIESYLANEEEFIIDNRNKDQFSSYFENINLRKREILTYFEVYDYLKTKYNKNIFEFYNDFKRDTIKKLLEII